jgi:hypothetical protein
MTSQIKFTISNDPGNLANAGRLVMLIPTLEGRDTLPDALRSVKPVLEAFSYIIISVNGTSSETALSIIFELFGDCAIRVLILCTGQSLGPMAHMGFMAGILSKALPHDVNVFLMSDDDMLCDKENILSYIRAYENQGIGCVGIGNLLSSIDLFAAPKNEAQHLSPGETISPLLFLRRNRSGHLFSSITGTIVPFFILLESWLFMVKMGSMGRRYEYIILAHSKVRSLTMPKASTATIRLHREQWGRSLPNKLLFRDEIIYFLWVWFNHPCARPFRSGHKAYGFTLARFCSLFLKGLRYDLAFLACLALSFRPSIIRLTYK